MIPFEKWIRKGEGRCRFCGAHPATQGILATSTTPGARAVLPVVEAELARARLAHPQEQT